MASRSLSVVAGALTRTKQTKSTHNQDAIAKRWRQDAPSELERGPQDVIPLLDGWIRRLERQARAEPQTELR